MQPEDDQQLWDLLGRTAEPKLSPFFARNVLREVRQGASRFGRAQNWFSLRRLVAASAMAVVVIGMAIGTYAPRWAPKHPRSERPPLSVSSPPRPCARAPPQRGGGRQAAPRPVRPPPVRSTQERFLSLPPAARQDFRRNAERWMRMSPQEREVLRQRESLRRAQIQRETNAALRDSGLSLDQQKRAQFESRYMQERRRMEQTLRQQIEAERQQQ